MYKIYGIIIFIFLLILIYLLNINNQESGTQYIQEGFYALSDDYERIDGVGFNSNSDNITNLNTSLILEDVLKECNTDKCKGITIIENDTDDSNNIKAFYKITNLDSSISQFQGIGNQRINAKKYVSYLKKSIPGIDKFYLSEDTMANQTFNICLGDMYLCVVNNQLQFMNKYKIQIKKLTDSTQFKISQRPNKNIAIQHVKTSKFIVHNFPSNNYLTLDNYNESNEQNSTFRMTSFNNNGFALKLSGFSDMYIFYNKNQNTDNNNESNIMVVKIKDKDNLKAGIFKFGLDLEIIDTKSIGEVEPTESPLQVKSSDDNTLTQQDRLVIFKNKNSSILEKQNAVLEDQTDKIKGLEMLHFSNIGDISREFAHQSARLAFSKYLTETQQITQTPTLK